ncbi:MAG: hypothetical protein A2148_03880 [Chloroflexi bacterium RBG_16_68_14]|nr:MAG: hypothetical protein A2148_03880 [Chloroflexi bacterium RBG_16_68_14]
MKAPLALGSKATEVRALPASATALPLLRALPVAGLLRWALLGAIVAGALFLRLYRMDGLITYYPDTYAQLRAVENLLSGQVPISYHYPPGVALFMAPIFILLPDSLLTMQAAILAAGIALVLVGYVVMLARTGDRRAALFLAAAAGLGGTFVFHSRVGWFDVINTLLIALSLFLAPLTVRRGLAALLPYGLLVFTTVTIRHTNLVVLPALFLASLDLGSRRLSWPLVVAHLRSRAVVTVGLMVLGLYVAYLGTASDSLARFFRTNTGDSIIDLSNYLPRLGDYLRVSLVGYEGAWGWEDAVAAAAVLALAAVGVQRLWVANRGLLAPLAYLILIWSPVHALYEIFDARYAMPPHFFLLFLAALGLSISLERLGGLPHPWQRVGLVSVLALVLALFVGRQLAHDIAFLQQWPDEVAHNREQAYDEIRVYLRTLDGTKALLVSSQALAVDRANPEMATYDLLPHSETYGINADSIARLLAYVREQQASGRTVYYHYTEYEDVGSRFRKYELGFDAYFQALQHEFTLRELVRADERPQRLYLVEPVLASN